jgi:type III secretion protein J
MKKYLRTFLLFTTIFLLYGCSENQSIVNNLDEREANEILVFLASKGITATKAKVAVTQTAGPAAVELWSIKVKPDKTIEAMSLLNQQGLPRKQGTTLLKLFEKSGLMSSDKEETIRYQAGLEEELKNIIRKIDGIIDADVQISFPSTEVLPGITPPKPKASVYIKHQGVFDDPNNHLEIKIKRLLAGAVENLDFEDVSIISDKSKLAGIKIQDQTNVIAAKAQNKEFVSIWSIVMTKSTAGKFKGVFFTLISLILVFGGLIGYLIYKYYPLMRKK